jgi:predicted amidohydrolase
MSDSSARYLRIAVSSLRVSDNVERNLHRMLELIPQAAQAGAQIVCFPEYSLNPVIDRWVDPADPIDSLQTACRENRIWGIFGADSGDAKNRKNSIYLLDPEGNIQYRYDKLHLWRSEKRSYQSGEASRVIDTELGRIAIISCWDMAYPKYVAELAEQGAEVIFCPSYLADYEVDEEPLQALPLVRAFENLVYFVLCDAVSDNTLSVSMICHPLGIRQQIAQAEGMLIGDLNLAELSTLRTYYSGA